MDRRRSSLALVALLVAGVVAGVLFREPMGRFLRGLMPVTDAAWEEQVRQDAMHPLLDVLRPDPRLPEDLDDIPEFWAKWNARRALYAPERLADLRRRLHGYLDFLDAEYADCAEIYRQGLLDTTKSDAAVLARRKLETDFGPDAKLLLRQADQMRDDAYKESPKTAQGPSDRNYLQIQEDFRAWLPRARARVELMTAPLEPAPQKR